MSWYGGFAPYVTVAERRKKAEKEAQKLAKKGRILAPVQPLGRAIATTFWGKAWCDHLEKHGDYANRLPRGRTYARNGSVIDLQVRAGEVTALVSGSSIYAVTVQIQRLPTERWAALAQDCAGRIESLVELLQGRLDKGVLQRLCHPADGMFPLPKQMIFRCSCPDGAHLCKHVAAALYGVGHRLDTQPELLFTLRQVDQRALVQHAATAPVATSHAAPIFDDAELSDVFGLDMDFSEPIATPAAVVAPVAKARPVKPQVAKSAPPPPVPAAKPSGRKSVPKQSPSAYVLAVLREFPQNECSVADLFDWQTRGQRHPRAVLQQALMALHEQGSVARVVDRQGMVFWAIA